MSIFQGSNINVRGSDGTAIGSNNTVTVIKQKHVHHHMASAGKSDNASGIVIGIALASTMILAAVSYFFALHAQTVYTGVRVLAAGEFALLLIAGIKATYDSDVLPSPKIWALLGVLVIASVALHFAQEAYLPELSKLASKVHGPMEFWCGLSPYGRQTVLLHTVSTTGGFGLGLLLVLVPTGALALKDLTGLEFASPRPTSWAFVLVGGALIAGAAYLHTGNGMVTWLKVVGQPATLTCSR